MKKIVIDAGHGGDAPGAIGHGLIEKDLTLDLALKVGKALGEYEIDEILYTRTSDISVKLEDRAIFANQHAADFFLSIHINAYDTKAEGFESYVYKLGSETAALQDVIHARIMAFLTTVGVKDRGKHENAFYVLKHTKMPALLIENLFVDHAYDARLLADEKFRWKLADAIAAGVSEAFNLQRKPIDDKQMAVEWLYKQGLLTSEDWKKDIEKPLPLWAEAYVLRRLYEILKK